MAMMRGRDQGRYTATVGPACGGGSTRAVPVTGLKSKAANLKTLLPAPRMVCVHDHLE
jgi:hypothetical protein